MIVKPKRLILLVVGVALLLVGAAFFPKPPSAESISKALDDTIIEELIFREATPGEALSTVMNHFHEKHPGLQKVHLEYYPTAEAVRLEQAKALWVLSGSHGSPPTVAPEWSSRVTVSLKTIPATKAFNYVTSLADVHYVVRAAQSTFILPQTRLRAVGANVLTPF